MRFFKRIIKVFPHNTPRLWIIIYLLLIYVLAFNPFYFTSVCFHQEIDWLPDEQGMHSSVCSAVSSPGPAHSLFAAFKGKRKISIEVLIRSQTNEQWGPARIVSYSADTAQRNFTLGQDRDALVFRLRTRITDRNAINPHLRIPGVFHPGEKQHIVLTYNGRTETVYVDGKQVKRSTFLTGSFGNWNPGCFLLVGNELTANRPWQGDIFLFALYNRALSAQEVQQNYREALLLPKENPSKGRVTKGLVGLYDFSEGAGQWVNDRSPGKQAGNLTLAGYYNFVRTISANFTQNFYVNDMIINVIGFIPISFLVFYNCPSDRLKQWRCIYLFPLLVGGLTSFSIEYIQQYSLFRDPNLWDLIYNVSGTLVGSLLLHGWLRMREQQ